MKKMYDLSSEYLLHRSIQRGISVDVNPVIIRQKTSSTPPKKEDKISTRLDRQQTGCSIPHDSTHSARKKRKWAGPSGCSLWPPVRFCLLHFFTQGNGTCVCHSCNQREYTRVGSLKKRRLGFWIILVDNKCSLGRIEWSRLLVS